MSRLFTFGCSFTRFVCPTWADILGKEFDFFENWGRPGSGNQYIFNSLIECNKRNKFTPNDTIIIVWSTTLREDRYIQQKGGWIGDGNIHWSSIYPSAWKKEFVCDRGALIRDLATISATIDLLKFWQVKHKMASILPIESGNNDILNLYKDAIDYLNPCINDIVFLHNRRSKDFFNVEKTPSKEQIEYLKESYNQCKGVDWPDFKVFFNKEYIDADVTNDIDNYGLNDSLYSITHENADHPSPKEHLFYIQQVFPEYQISESTVEWINNFKYGQKFEQHLPERL